MKALLSYRLPIISILLLLAIPFITIPLLLNGIIACTILSIWYNEYYRTKKIVLETEGTQKKEPQPQLLNKDLKEFIRAELAIAQEDIIEINNIIIDSTMVLQDSTQSIFKNLKKYHGALLSLGSASNTTHSILPHLKETKENIILFQSAIDCFGLIPNNIYSPSYNLAIPHTERQKKIKTPYILKDNMALKSLDTAGDIKKSLALAHKKIDEAIEKMSAPEEKNNVNNAPIEQHKKIENEIITSIGDIIKALQFESIANEIKERAVSNIERTSLIIEKVSQKNDSNSKEKNHRISKEINAIKKDFYHN